MSKEEFINYLKQIGIELTDKQQNQLKDYANLLLEYNKHTNITSIDTIEGVYLKHFYDSLTVYTTYKFSNETVLDIGSGGGFPGIVLKIVFPNLKVTLLDSNNKKSEFQKFIVNKLELSEIEIVNDRAENYFKQGKKFDIVIARAVANLNVLSELCIPFVKLKGYFISMKGEIKEELTSSLNAINILGGKIITTNSFKLPIENSIRNILLIEKVKETPNKYPRPYNKILKNQLK